MNLLTPHQFKALNYKKHISLTANAGSGKTFVLAKRYLEIACNEDLSLRNIAAITFTDKAAGELYQKIAKEIDSRIQVASDQKLVRQLENLRRQLVSANISTIHSFCIDILREHPVEAKIDANFTPINEIFSDELIELSVEEVIRNSLEDSDDTPNLKYLIRHFASKSSLAKELTNSVKHRRNILNLSEKIYCKSDDEIAKDFYKTFLEFADNILNRNFKKFIKSVETVNFTVLKSSPKNQVLADIKNIIQSLEKEKNVERIISLLINLKSKMLIKSGTIAARGYLNKGDRELLDQDCVFIEGFFDELTFFEIPSNHKLIEHELGKLGKAFIHFFNKSLELYNDKKQAGGYLDYEDILLLTQDILLNEEVKKSLVEKFKYIMIDEYQDTNELQYNIFLPILDYLQSGNLFVVGDEKQSIYMFRDAELEIFNKTKSEIIGKEGNESLLSLPDSFRMAPYLCLFINTVFRKLFAKPDPLFNEVEHSDVVCARTDTETGNVEILLTESSDGTNEEKAEAELVTQKIIELVNAGSTKSKIKWGDIAVLCRKRKSFIELEKILVQKGIPFSIIGGKGFYQRQTIYDIYNYFSFLLDQNDDTALVGILRSPFFSISDSEIYEISTNSGSNFWQKFRAHSKQKSDFATITLLLEENISLINKVEISILLRKILYETGYQSMLSQKPNSVQEQANIDKLINLTINFFNEEFRTLYDYVNYLKDAINEVEDESQAVISDELNSVKIMTVHQAKGLEFPIVFLYRCGESTRKPFVKSKSISVNKDFGLLAKVPLDENYFGEYYSAPIVGLGNYISERKNIAEIKRLFYVGITRAKNQLFISASASDVESSRKDSFIGLLKSGLDDDLLGGSYSIRGKLKYLKNENEHFSGEEKELAIEIPIIKKIDSNLFSSRENITPVTNKSLLTEKILDMPQGEMISATKISIYNQCPMKFKLIYELGFSNLMDQYRGWIKSKNNIETLSGFDFNSFEEQILSLNNHEEVKIFERKSAQLKGTIIHKLLSEEVSSSELEKKINDHLQKMAGKEISSSSMFGRIREDIHKDVVSYRDSKNYYLINKFDQFKNEFEIYHQKDTYYLFGIIDKIIFNKDEIIIVEYKTDSVSIDELDDRANQYFIQLKFYAYIASKLFRGKRGIELCIIFLKHPNNLFSLRITNKDLNLMQNNIEEMVRNIRSIRHQKNLNHCQFCIFQVDNNCIVS